MVMVTVPPMTVLADLEHFVTDHRSHGELTPSGGLPTENGYLIEVACTSGVTFGRWVTHEDAVVDLALEHLRGRN
jgi:hypothetical protein